MIPRDLGSSILRIFTGIIGFFQDLITQRKPALIDEELIVEELKMMELITWFIECRKNLPKVTIPTGLVGVFKELTAQVDELRSFYPGKEHLDDIFFQILYDTVKNRIVKFRVIKYKSLSAEIEAEMNKSKNKFLVFQNF